MLFVAAFGAVDMFSIPLTHLFLVEAVRVGVMLPVALLSAILAVWKPLKLRGALNVGAFVVWLTYAVMMAALRVLGYEMDTGDGPASWLWAQTILATTFNYYVFESFFVTKLFLFGAQVRLVGVALFYGRVLAGGWDVSCLAPRVEVQSQTESKG